MYLVYLTWYLIWTWCHVQMSGTWYRHTQTRRQQLQAGLFSMLSAVSIITFFRVFFCVVCKSFNTQPRVYVLLIRTVGEDSIFEVQKGIDKTLDVAVRPFAHDAKCGMGS